MPRPGRLSRCNEFRGLARVYPSWQSLDASPRSSAEFHPIEAKRDFFVPLVGRTDRGEKMPRPIWNAALRRRLRERVKYRRRRLNARRSPRKYILLPRDNINYREDAARRLARKNMIYRNNSLRRGYLWERQRGRADEIFPSLFRFGPFRGPVLPVTNRSDFSLLLKINALNRYRGE